MEIKEIKNGLPPILYKYYRDDNNSYHNLNHIAKMLQTFFKYEKELEKEESFDERLVIEAIMWHDAGYIPGDSNNELRAIDLYDKHHLYTDKAIVDMIMNTIPFSKKPDDFSSKIVHDLDWMGFSDYDEMVKNERLIFSESGLDLEDFLARQKAFYQKCLDFFGKEMYYTECFYDFGEKAYHNINRRIQEI